MILRQIIDLYSLIVLGAVVVSWMQLPPSNPLAQFVHAVTERRVLPSMGGLDFSPMVLFFGLQMLKGLF